MDEADMAVDRLAHRPRGARRPTAREAADIAAEVAALVTRQPGLPARGPDAVREYLLCLLVAAAVTYLLTPPVARRWRSGCGAMAEVRDRDVHDEPTPRLGGLAMVGGLLAGCSLAQQAADDAARCSRAATEPIALLSGVRDHRGARHRSTTSGASTPRPSSPGRCWPAAVMALPGHRDRLAAHRRHASCSTRSRRVLLTVLIVVVSDQRDQLRRRPRRPRRRDRRRSARWRSSRTPTCSPSSYGFDPRDARDPRVGRCSRACAWASCRTTSSRPASSWATPARCSSGCCWRPARSPCPGRSTRARWPAARSLPALLPDPAARRRCMAVPLIDLLLAVDPAHPRRAQPVRAGQAAPAPPAAARSATASAGPCCSCTRWTGAASPFTAVALAFVPVGVRGGLASSTGVGAAAARRPLARPRQRPSVDAPAHRDRSLQPPWPGLEPLSALGCDSRARRPPADRSPSGPVLAPHATRVVLRGRRHPDLVVGRGRTVVGTVRPGRQAAAIGAASRHGHRRGVLRRRPVRRRHASCGSSPEIAFMTAALARLPRPDPRPVRAHRCCSRTRPCFDAQGRSPRTIVACTLVWIGAQRLDRGRIKMLYVEPREPRRPVAEVTSERLRPVPRVSRRSDGSRRPASGTTTPSGTVGSRRRRPRHAGRAARGPRVRRRGVGRRQSHDRGDPASTAASAGWSATWLGNQSLFDRRRRPLRSRPRACSCCSAGSSLAGRARDAAAGPDMTGTPHGGRRTDARPDRPRRRWSRTVSGSAAARVRRLAATSTPAAASPRPDAEIFHFDAVCRRSHRRPRRSTSPSR